MKLHAVLIHKALNYVYTSDGFGVKVNRDISRQGPNGWGLFVFGHLLGDASLTVS